jgi:hypothetical protein
MSEIVTGTVEVTDINALKAACEEMGITFVENATSYKGWCSQYPCTHKIIPKEQHGRGLEIGIGSTGKAFVLSYDHFLDKEIGAGASRLLQLYTVHKATMEAKRRGLVVQRKTVPGSQKIRLVCTGM